MSLAVTVDPVDTVQRRLAQAGSGFTLLSALALLDHFARRAGATSLGDERGPREGAIALSTRASLSFPSAEIDRIVTDDAGRATVQTAAFGLLGHIGPLPDWLTEELAQRARRGDRAAMAFLRIFEQRLLAIAFRARTRTQLGYAFHAPEASAAGRVIQALAGLGTPGLAGRMGVPDRAVLGNAGLLAGHARSHGALERMLRAYAGVPVTVVPFTGRWLRLEADDITRLGTPGANNRLGRSALIGCRVWDRQSCFTLRVGPLEPDEFASCLPGGARYRAIEAMTRIFTGPGLAFHMELRMRPHRITPLRLHTRALGARLGWTSFLVARPDTRAVGAVSLAAGEWCSATPRDAAS